MAVGLTCCYFKHLGWPARQIMTNPILTAIIGAYMDTKLSTRRISGFIRANALNMSDYVKQDYRCFNDFFTRQVKAGARPINTDRDTLISPCDGYMSAYKISSDSEFAIKNSYYNVEDLVGGADIADDYINGTCLVLRLGVENYHRYCYIDDGFKSRNWHIQGRYHPVQPIVVRKRPVFMQNTREYERQNHYQTDNSCSHFFLLAPFAKIIVSTYDKYYTELLHHLQRYSYKKFKNSEIASYIRK